MWLVTKRLNFFKALNEYKNKKWIKKYRDEIVFVYSLRNNIIIMCVAKALMIWKMIYSIIDIQIEDYIYLCSLQFTDDQAICDNDEDDLQYMACSVKEYKKRACK